MSTEKRTSKIIIQAEIVYTEHTGRRESVEARATAQYGELVTAGAGANVLDAVSQAGTELMKLMLTDGSIEVARDAMFIGENITAAAFTGISRD